MSRRGGLRRVSSQGEDCTKIHKGKGGLSQNSKQVCHKNYSEEVSEKNYCGEVP